MGGGDDGPYVVPKDVGIVGAVEQDFPVGIVTDEKDLGPVLLLFPADDGCQLLDNICAVHHARGVIR